MSELIELRADDGHELAAHIAGPESAAAAVVIVQEIFGLNSHIRSVVDRYAALGYRTIAPALFDRVERGVELDYDADGIARGRAIMADMDWADAVRDVGAAVARVGDDRPVVVVGYCWGGSLAYLASTRLPVDAAVGYYGGQIVGFLDEEVSCPLLLHFGAEDASISLADVEQIRAAKPDVTVHVYEGVGHGFSCDARGSYDAAAAGLALDRTLEFIGSVLSGDGPGTGS